MTPGAKKNIIDGIIARETSKYTETKGDRGGPTKYGITLKTLQAYRGPSFKLNATDVELLREDEARAIYEKIFINDPRFNLINDDSVATLLIDWGVMSGPDDSIKALQRVLNAHGSTLKVDGILGSKTAGAANEFYQQSVLRNLIVDAKIIFHIQDVEKNPAQLKFLEGWVNRTLTFRA